MLLQHWFGLDVRLHPEMLLCFTKGKQICCSKDKLRSGDSEDGDSLDQLHTHADVSSGTPMVAKLQVCSSAGATAFASASLSTNATETLVILLSLYVVYAHAVHPCCSTNFHAYIHGDSGKW